MRALIAGCVLMGLTGTVIAAEAPPLPPSAKKLTAAEIMSTMGGKTLKYTSYSKADVKTGTTTFDFKKMKFWGTYEGKKYNAMDLGMSGDGYCYETPCSSPMSIYQDGKKIYEVKDGGTVNAVLTR